MMLGGYLHVGYLVLLPMVFLHLVLLVLIPCSHIRIVVTLEGGGGGGEVV